VHQKVDPRKRHKSDPFWHRIAIVRQRLGRTSHSVCDGRTTTTHFIDNLKTFSIGEEVIKDKLAINPAVIESADEFYGIPPLHDFDHICLDFDEFKAIDHVHRVTWIGCPGLEQMQKVADFLLEGAQITSHIIVPDLPDEPIEFWISDEDDKAVLQAPIIWWLAQVPGEGV